MALSRENVRTMIVHRVSSFNKCRDLLWESLKKSDSDNLLDHEFDSVLISLNNMKAEIEALEGFVLERKPKN